MAKATPENTYKILIDGQWELEDLSKFPRAFEQVYYAYYSLLNAESKSDDRISRAYRLYPWTGGYSAVNFFNELKYSVPKNYRPQIKSLYYASPGWIELFGVIALVSSSMAISVNNVCNALERVNSTYQAIYKGLVERKLLRLKVQNEELLLSKNTLEFLKESNDAMAKILFIESEKLDEMKNSTGSELKTLKVLLSIYRRVRIIAEYVKKGKAKL